MTEDSLWGAFIALMVVFGIGHLWVGLVNPEVIKHRMFPRKGTETWDWVWAGVFAPVYISILVVAYYDIRSGWAPLPMWVWPIGVVLFILGGGLFLRAMAESPFFEKTVRIQSERGHYVVDTGPYRMVRHPGYVGMLAWLFSFPLLLTSTWALLPTVLAMISLVIRTVLEDRTLQKKLEGYTDYVTRVRWRLIPGLW